MDDKKNEIREMIPGAVGLAMVLPKMLKLLAALFRDTRVPKYLKILTVGAVAYVGLPLDFLPDFVPTAGRMDDLLVILLLLVQYVKACPPDVFREHWDTIMGENYDVTGDVERALNELEPLVGERFAGLRDTIMKAAGRLALGEHNPPPDNPLPDVEAE